MSLENEMLIRKLFQESPMEKYIRPVAKKYLDRVSSGEQLVLKNTVGDMPLNSLSIYGKTWQNTTTGAQLYDVSEISKDFNLNFDDDGWITVKLDNTSNESEGYKTIYAKPSKLIQPSRTYIIVCEIKSLIGGTLGAVTNYVAAGQTGQFKTEARYNSTGTFVTQIIARDDFEDCATMLRNTWISDPGENSECTFRLSILDDTTVTADTFVYEPFTGGKPSPNPEYQQEIVSIGNAGNIDVEIYGANLLDYENNQTKQNFFELTIMKDGGHKGMQTLSIQTPNGLPGIPVSDASLANYTDQNGQMWCCDEVDLERGVHVQRIGKMNLTSDLTYIIEAEKLYTRFAVACGAPLSQARIPAISNRFVFGTSHDIGTIFTYGGKVYIYPPKTVTTAGELKIWLDANPTEVFYVLKNPIEKQVTEEEVEAFENLKTNENITTVLNSESAYMSVGYKVPLPKRSKNSALKMWFREHPII